MTINIIQTAGMKIKESITEEQYNEALKRLEVIFDAPVDSTEGEEAELLLILIKKYEDENHLFEAPDPTEGDSLIRMNRFASFFVSSLKIILIIFLCIEVLALIGGIVFNFMHPNTRGVGKADFEELIVVTLVTGILFSIFTLIKSRSIKNH